ncbi:uncharacterized protein [Littorina saxatilis]|uniref:Uncharacterized protein n=1 Tax=Littorina saxatilis TaxID=31220 RepID=A0AAN9G3C6_9CAEN
MFWVLLTTLLSLTTALQWTDSLTNNTVMTVCSASDIHLPWNFTLSPDERIEDIKWIYRAEDGSDELIAIFAAGQIITTPAYTGRVQWTGQGGIVVSQAESGNYSVVVSTGDTALPLARFFKTVSVQVTDPPIVESGKLHVLQKSVVYDNTTGQWRLVVTCGDFTFLGHPRVHVIWTTPDGHTVESSSEHNGTFRLLLPNPPSGGNYTCSLPPLSPATRCLPPLSPLLEGATVTVDEVKVSFALLEARQGETEARLEAKQRETEARLEAKQRETEARLEAKQRETEARLEARLRETEAKEQNMSSENARLQAELDAVKKENDQQNNTTETLKARLATATVRVSFHAMLTSDFTSSGPLTPFTVITNEGNDFSCATGIFIAPRKGTYFFAASAGTDSSDKYMDMFLLKDGVAVSRALARQYSGYHTMGSVQATLYLTAGQRVWLHSGRSDSYYFSAFTSFTGFLLLADD